MSPHGRELVRSEWVVALALIVLIPCLVGLWWVDRQRAIDVRQVQAIESWAAYDAAMGSCDRGNVLRAAADDQATALRQVSFILSAFLDSSVDLREGAGRPGLADEAGRARDAIARIADQIPPTPQIECDEVIRPPQVPRPSD